MHVIEHKYMEKINTNRNLHVVGDCIHVKVWSVYTYMHTIYTTQDEMMNNLFAVN